MATVNKDGTITYEDGDNRKGTLEDVSPVKTSITEDEGVPERDAKFASDDLTSVKKLLGNLPAGWKYIEDDKPYRMVRGQRVPKNAIIQPGGTVMIQQEGKYFGCRAIVWAVKSYEKGRIVVRIQTPDIYRGNQIELASFNDYAILTSNSGQVDPDDYTVRMLKK